MEIWSGASVSEGSRLYIRCNALSNLTLQEVSMVMYSGFHSAHELAQKMAEMGFCL